MHWSDSSSLWLIVVACMRLAWATVPSFHPLNARDSAAGPPNFSAVMWCVGYRKDHKSLHQSLEQLSAHVCNDWWPCSWCDAVGRCRNDGGEKWRRAKANACVFQLQGRVLDNGISSWVLYQLCFRWRSFSLCRRFCMVLSARQKKESVFFCLSGKTLSFRKDSRRMYTS